MRKLILGLLLVSGISVKAKAVSYCVEQATNREIIEELDRRLSGISNQTD